MTDAAVFILSTDGVGYVAQDSRTGWILAAATDLDLCAEEAFQIAPTCNVIAVVDDAGRTKRTIHRNLAPVGAPRAE